jgi:hypothetical protein
MTADPKLQALLFELGELEAAKLWQTEVVMGMLRVSTQQDAQEYDDTPQYQEEEEPTWRPRLAEDVGRPSWSGYQSPDRRRPRSPRKGRTSGRR